MTPKGQPDGEIRNSMTFFYRLLGKNERRLGEKVNGSEGVQKNKDGSFPILDKDEVVFEPNIVYRRIRDEKPA